MGSSGCHVVERDGLHRIVSVETRTNDNCACPCQLVVVELAGCQLDAACKCRICLSRMFIQSISPCGCLALIFPSWGTYYAWNDEKPYCRVWAESIPCSPKRYCWRLICHMVFLWKAWQMRLDLCESDEKHFWSQCRRRYYNLVFVQASLGWVEWDSVPYVCTRWYVRGVVLKATTKLLHIGLSEGNRRYPLRRLDSFSATS